MERDFKKEIEETKKVIDRLYELFPARFTYGNRFNQSILFQNESELEKYKKIIHGDYWFIENYISDLEDSLQIPRFRIVTSKYYPKRLYGGRQLSRYNFKAYMDGRICSDYYHCKTHNFWCDEYKSEYFDEENGAHIPNWPDGFLPVCKHDTLEIELSTVRIDDELNDGYGYVNPDLIEMLEEIEKENNQKK